MQLVITLVGTQDLDHIKIPLVLVSIKLQALLQVVMTAGTVKNFAYYADQTGDATTGNSYAFYSEGTAPTYQAGTFMLGAAGEDTASTASVSIKPSGDANFKGKVVVGNRDPEWFSGNLFHLGVNRGILVNAESTSSSITQRNGNNLKSGANAFIFERSLGNSTFDDELKTPVNNGTNLGSIEWKGWDGSAYQLGAAIKAVCKATPWTSADTNLKFQSQVFNFGADLDNINSYCLIDNDGVTIPTGKDLKLVDIPNAEALGTDADGKIIAVSIQHSLKWCMTPKMMKFYQVYTRFC